MEIPMAFFCSDDLPHELHDLVEWTANFHTRRVVVAVITTMCAASVTFVWP